MQPPLERLGLLGNRGKSIAVWIMKANIFYSQALDSPELLERLAGCGVNRKSLERGREQLEGIKSLHRKNEMANGRARMSTKERDGALEELKGWLTRYRAVARVALAEMPQLIEQLGIMERS